MQKNPAMSRISLRTLQIDAASRAKARSAVVLALVATCIFGRMSVVAAISAFENQAPTLFQQLAGFWDLLRWLAPAMLIGTQLRWRALPVAAIISLIGGLILLALDYASFVPIGSVHPDSIYFWGALAELGKSAAVAASTAVIVQIAYRWIVGRSSLQENVK